MPITSLIVKVTEDDMDKTLSAIDGMEGVEVTDVKGNDLVVILDTASRKQDRELWQQLEELPGVHALNAIYHNFEDLEA